MEREADAPENVELARTDAPAEERSAAPVTDPATSSAPTPLADHPWAGSFAGLTGRLVEADGAPVEGLEVELYEFDLETVFADGHHPVREELCMGKARSGADGRFFISGARSTGFHGVAIDPGGGRYTLRFVDTSLEPGAEKDMGDIVLEPGGVVVGTVVDEDGDPVEGARVRFAPVPEIVVQSGALDLRSDSLVGIDTDGEVLVMDPRAKLRVIIDRLPASTGSSDAEGRFRIEGVPIGRVTGGADAPGLVAGPVEGVTVKAGSEVDVGEIELLFGRTITGKVVDANEQPVADAEVRVGALSPLIPVGLLQPGVRTGPDGAFELDGVPEEGQVFGAARRSADHEWVAAKALGIAESITLRLPTLAPLRVEVVDIQGAPISGARIAAIASAAPDAGDGVSMGSRGMLGTLMDRTPKTRGAEEVEPGVYLVEELPLGWYSIEAEAPGHGLARTLHEHEAGGSPARIECSPAWSLGLRYVNDATGEPVTNVHARLMQTDGIDAFTAASDWSDESGHAEIGPLGQFAQPREQLLSDFTGLLLTSEHPGYARSFDRISGEKAAEGPLEIRLKRSSTVKGRVTWNGKAPRMPYMVMIEPEERNEWNLQLPRMAVTGPDGSYRIGGMAPGKYRLELYERFLNRSPLSFITEQEEPRQVATEVTSTTAGEESEVDFVLLEGGEAAPGWFEGRVLVDGQVPLRTVVKVGFDDEKTYGLDGNGNFKTEELPCDRGHWVRIVQMADPSPDELRIVASEERIFYDDYRRPVSGRGTRIDLDVSTREVVVTVIDEESLDPIDEAYVRFAKGSTKRTDALGVARLSTGDEEDEIELRVAAPGHADVQVSVALAESGITEVEVRMKRAVPCAGTVVLPESTEDEEGRRVWIMIGEAGSDSSGESTWVHVEPDLTFTADDVSAGPKVARFGERGSYRTVTFELPPGGDEALLLDFSQE
ncbi:MAG: carboxypeptidase-like regulatory domain-containing protein [Planctomycetota bacterium]|nr:carboxypeptidase-like regulatory domain-containing protein [Planctomycetota bacterium]